MLTTVGLYTLTAANGAPAIGSIITVGLIVLVATALVAWRLPPDRLVLLNPKRIANSGRSVRQA